MPAGSIFLPYVTDPRVLLIMSHVYGRLLLLIVYISILPLSVRILYDRILIALVFDKILMDLVAHTEIFLIRIHLLVGSTYGAAKLPSTMNCVNNVHSYSFVESRYGAAGSRIMKHNLLIPCSHFLRVP
jgi:hypothetical protein